ncbi:hypothetical protein F7725_018238 [Dissostichus mawsoni]|uniref:Uncharacterized protein n=1 Tax=Dissostichus mawsoni TaxID=36200 RepID=A0A7J5XRN7_DISMA|nr:hypothetical protein F7725_018238 [Dissostichus mawsoni]
MPDPAGSKTPSRFRSTTEAEDILPTKGSEIKRRFDQSGMETASRREETLLAAPKGSVGTEEDMSSLQLPGNIDVSGLHMQMRMLGDITKDEDFCTVHELASNRLSDNVPSCITGSVSAAAVTGDHTASIQLGSLYSLASLVSNPALAPGPLESEEAPPNLCHPGPVKQTKGYEEEQDLVVLQGAAQPHKGDQEQEDPDADDPRHHSDAGNQIVVLMLMMS